MNDKNKSDKKNVWKILGVKKNIVNVRMDEQAEKSVPFARGLLMGGGLLGLHKM